MKKRLFLLAFSLILVGSLFSCISGATRTMEYGKDLTAPSNMIVTGKTTEAEVRNSLGEPAKKEAWGTGQRLVYEYSLRKEDTLYGVKTDEKVIQKQTLEIYVDDKGVVADKKFKDEKF